MTEAELLAGITDALTLAGFRWTHIRDSRGITVGNSGLPDIVAAKGGRVLAWELKSQKGQPTYDQLAWLRELENGKVDARLIRPDQYDSLLKEIFGVEEER